MKTPRIFPKSGRRCYTLKCVNKIVRAIGFLGVFLGGTGGLRAEILQLAGGTHQSGAVVSGGDVLQWGELGGPLPASIFGLDRVRSIAAGAHHMLALRVDGTVWAWGANNAGQLGNGTV